MSRYPTDRPLPTKEWAISLLRCEDSEELWAGVRIDWDMLLDVVMHRLRMGLPRLVPPPPPTRAVMESLLRGRGYQLQLTNGKGSFWMPPDGGKCLRLKAAYAKERELGIQGRRR